MREPSDALPCKEREIDKSGKNLQHANALESTLAQIDQCKTLDVEECIAPVAERSVRQENKVQ